MDVTNFMDEMECGNFFDHIDDLLDSPTDDLNSDLIGTNGVCGSFPINFPGSSSEALLSSDSVFSGSVAPDLSAQLSVPYEDIVQLEWLSNFVEDSFSGGGMTMEKNIDISQSNQFRTSSPVSVLESSSSSSTGKPLPSSHEKRARSKRPRPPTFTPNPNAMFVPCYPPVLGSVSTGSEPARKILNDQPKKKTKKIKIVPPSNPADPNQNQNDPTQAVRKCMHCEITKTPQWRAGPMGPKTLCNACGVRHKSGRLFPEYRPAASPTFIPSVHSNSHKKVIELRTTKASETPVFGDIEQQCNISI